jgi:rhodanese-related sulfurtransferase
VKPVYRFDDPPVDPKRASKVQLVDVRAPALAAQNPVPNSISIPHLEAKKRAKELDPTVEYRTVCNFGKTAYFASRNLIQAGLVSSTLVGGMRVHGKPKPKTTKTN